MNLKIFLVHLIIKVALIDLKFIYCADETDYSRLRQKLLENYDARERPVENHTDNVTVEMGFMYLGMHFDEQRGVLTLHLWTTMYWNDARLKWDPLAYGNITHVPFSTDDLWRPEVACINRFNEGETEDREDFNQMGVFSDSKVWWHPYTNYQVQCHTNFRLWPYDKQTCVVFVSTWAYYASEVHLQLSEDASTLEIYDTDPMYQTQTEIGDWKMVNNSVVSNIYRQYCCPPIEYAIMTITVKLERMSSSHTAAVTIVGLGIATTILVSFWLDPFAKERLPVTLLLILLNSVYLMFMHRAIPNNGATVPLTICFFRDSLIMVTWAFAWTVGIRYLARTKRNSPVPLPNFIGSFLNSVAVSILCLTPRPQTLTQVKRKDAENSAGGDENADVSELVREDGDDKNSSAIQQDWEWLARFLDRIAFVAYAVTYFVFIVAFL